MDSIILTEEILFDDEKLLEIINKLEIYIKTLKRENSKIYFSSEFDSNQSKFEEKSNNLKIGVICDNENLAYLLLFFVRCTFENFIDRFARTLSFYKNSNLLIEEIFNILAKAENYRTEVYDITEEFTRTLSGYKDGKRHDILIKRNISDIDIWTYRRVFKYIEENCC